ncbi:baculovirus repeated namegeneORF [Condylorrhiza vestigialis mutiple nucleopolyhedrovirus]|uniref:Baculovirus repeated namegeneORF n=1 Tax=Condylorrhiza vestigialis mutiple nucleopolyhedrovirus TaxID=1592576 RepID=A0A0B4UKC7_9ABAC|nr:baculovirus repeated namegeneORF [Condylorrhiza vestigialis mutiple nucleopolyhedrovirus]AJD09275.1 baculovirus repeated namegeneORF [Condylorrhiza vestigialis mutiple nucleopolyhedrovirus]
MALSKVNFVNGPLEVFTVADDKHENWMVANPFAEALNYSRPNKAICEKVSSCNQKTYEELRSHQVGATQITSTLPKEVQAKTKFINTAGVFELINASEMPAAKKFKQWNANDLMPTLCKEGEYNMAMDAPVEIAEGMNAVHAAVNNGQEAPWIKDMEVYKQALVEKDEKIETLTTMLVESNQQVVKFANALVVANENLIKANNNLHEANQSLNHMANRMADIAQDVIAKPNDPQLLHSLAVCALGNDEYAFLRAQKRTLGRSLRRLGSSDVVFSSDYVPNAMNVLNKVKESLPRDKFKAKHNKITLLENLTRDQLIEAVQSSMTERQIARRFNEQINKN